MGTASPAAQLQPVLALAVANGGTQHVVVALRPAELGAVEVRIRHTPDGAVSVTLAAERPETLHALRRDEAHLAQALDRAGVPAHARTVSFAELAAAEPGDRNPGQRQPGAQRQGEPQAAAPPSGSAHTGSDAAGQHRAAQERTASERSARPGGDDDAVSAPGAATGMATAPARWLHAGIDITA